MRLGSVPHSHPGIQADGGHCCSAGGQGKRMEILLGAVFEPRLDVAYITSAHIPLAVLSHMAPNNGRRGWET